MRHSIIDQEQFIIDYLKEYACTSVCDQEFHEQFHQRFGGKFKPTCYGAQPVYKAQRLLARMYKDRTLSRGIIGNPERISGFPAWEYVYCLNKVY